MAVVSINGLYATAESYEHGTQATIAIDVAGCDSDGQTLIACLHQNVNSGDSAFEDNTYDAADRTARRRSAATGSASGSGTSGRTASK